MARKRKKSLIASLTGFFEDSLLGRYLAKSVESWLNKTTGAGLTGAEKEANQFNHDEAELNWERNLQFYRENESLAARVRQYEELGLNKAGLVGSPVAAAPSVSNASSVSPSSGGISELMSLFLLPAQIRNLNASARQKDSQSTLNEIEAVYRPELLSTRIDSVVASTDEARQRIRTGQADEALKRAGLSRTEAETALLWNQVAALQMDMAHSSALHMLEVKRSNLQNELLRAQIASTNANTERTRKTLEREIQEIDARVSLMRQQALTEASKRLSMAENDKYIKELTASIKNENERKAVYDSILQHKESLIKFADEKKLESFENGQFLDFVDALSDQSDDFLPYTKPQRGLVDANDYLGEKVTEHVKKRRKK